ncbi:riboflavin kinase/FMN adenylyltransferase [Natranaerovirga pectinivora]|uniref:Riboflavin biosynthesis protein n=1 Tax=Natranaerovirga pectinivora TaxID=682400 RepID=A0A4R3MKF9_9FIRM|nr:bifunctional riboflavin kinase/FAD synthetase [Natranaerovirga pectinivora]TCT15047.1 riboflavin kinase/FMN adenylyltransferase [Natranaerovirga pectinivora]
MNYIVKEKKFNFKDTAVALGNFDGIHKGHQLLLKEVLEGKKEGLTSVAFTFNPHPSYIIASKKPVELILVGEERANKFDRLGIDVLIEYPFNEETLHMSPLNFIEEILIKQLDAKLIVVGNDYRFGHKRQGDINFLKNYASTYGYEIKIIEKKKINGIAISSSLIRETIKEGDMEKAKELLGESFRIIGKVDHGKKIGRKLGFPTANLVTKKDKLLPPNGVYATRTRIDNTWYNSITNIGVNPTVDSEGKNRTVETYIYDISLELYGHTIEVELLKYLREEQKFDSFETLQNQIVKDILEAKNYLKSTV